MDIHTTDAAYLIPAVIGFIGVLVGTIASLGGTYFLEHVRERRNCKALATALRAEVQAMLHVEEAHSFRAIYQDTLDRIRLGHTVAMPNISYETNPARSVYYTNLSRIGILAAPISEKMVRLSYMFEVVATDRTCMDKGEWNKQEPSKRIDMLEKHLKAYDGFVTLARAVSKDLESAC